MVLVLPPQMLKDIWPVGFYQPIPKNACTSVKKEIFWHRFGFGFPEIPHWRRHGALIHIHQVMPTRRVPLPTGEKCLVLVRDPISRFESAFREKVLFNEEFSDVSALSRRIQEVMVQVRCDSYDNRVLRDHFRPQCYWVALLRPEDRVLVDCSEVGHFLHVKGTRANDSRTHTRRSRNTELIAALTEVVGGLRDELYESYMNDVALVAEANRKKHSRHK
mgnify:CR=1 FL=1